MSDCAILVGSVAVERSGDPLRSSRAIRVRLGTGSSELRMGDDVLLFSLREEIMFHINETVN